MVHWALYLDETGLPDAHNEPLRSSETPIFTLAGVALPLDRWREYDRAYLYLKREFFSAEIDKSSKVDAVWEVKGSDLLAPRNATSERNAAFTHRVLDLIKQFEGRVIGVSFLKAAATPMARTSIYTKGLQIVAERFDVFLREQDSSGAIILDSRMAHLQKGRGLDYTVAVSYLSFIFGNEQGRMLKRIVEAPLFADSGLTVGLQIADVVAGIVYTNAYREKLAPEGANSEFGFLDYRHTKRFLEVVPRTYFRKPTDLRQTQDVWGEDARPQRWSSATSSTECQIPEHPPGLVRKVQEIASCASNRSMKWSVKNCRRDPL